MHNIISKNGCQMKRWRLFIFATFFALTALTPSISYAHQTPNTLVFLDVSPNSVAMEIQLPVTELELAFGNNITKNPETLIERLGPQLKEYLKAHIHAYVTRNDPWQVDVEDLKMDKGKYIESGINYWEVIAHVILKPQPRTNTRKFMLDYDVIMHQVMNHVALVSIRSDWETGSVNNTAAEATAISWNIKDNVIYPLEINLQQGTWFKGFKSMLTLGMQHIKEGTDHLLFLVVLLLPATLLIRGKNWGKFGGTKYSVFRLLKIVTSFTIGHSVTLLIGALGWVRLPAQPVEILIAFSILVSAVHAIKPLFPGKEMFVAAGFGLIHGLAFASVLANLKLSAGTMALSILGFNLGIEFMQLFVVLMIIPWLILLSQTPLYKYVRVGGAAVGGIAAIAWILERFTNETNFISKFILSATPYFSWLILAFALFSVLTFLYFKGKKYKELNSKTLSNY